ncbi:hypothetical protein GGR58DRAFT_527051 [Xylaria digitata]|nr:hypothetical protein GGR58DRAFT_527051 [Xylaria digitata]
MEAVENISLRPQYAKKLEEIVKSCRDEHEQRQGQAQPIHDSTTNFTANESWLISKGEWAIQKLDDLWKNSTTYLRVPNLDEEHLSVTMYSLTTTGHRGQVTIRRLITLQEAWDSVCSKTPHKISVKDSMLANLKGIFDHETHIDENDLYEAALTAFLFMVKDRFSFGLEDLFDLMTSYLYREEKEENDGSIFSNLTNLKPDPCLSSETCDTLGMGDACGWHSVTMPPSAFSRPAGNSTITIAFPDSFPEFSTKYYLMERHQPHSKPPRSRSVFSIWGTWVTTEKWTCICVGADLKMTDSYREKPSEISEKGSDAQRNALASHWAECIHHLYHLGLNNTRLIVREGLKQLDSLKYQNIAKPKVGAAHVCLMYMNHLQYHRRLLQVLQAHVMEAPRSWKLPKDLPWKKGVRRICQGLVRDTRIVHSEASTTRELIIKQLELTQTGQLGFLTILATFFVPLSAVASIFGMNTKEINKSEWPIKYYIASAVPLTVVSVLLPLFALRLLKILIRLRALVTPHQGLKWFTLLAIFILNLSLDIMYYVFESASFDYASLRFIPLLYLNLVYFIPSLRGSQLVFKLRLDWGL